MTDANPPTDGELIAGIRSGDADALEQLVNAYWDTLVQFAGRVLGGQADPQDVVQEAFIRIWTHRERWDADGSVRSLLYTVTRNAALDERRRHARGERAARATQPPVSPTAPSDDAQAAQLREAAFHAVEALPSKRRAVFRLAREEGLTYGEIAAVMGISAQTVANHMSLALADLRTALAPHLDTPRPSPRVTPPAP
ncbi:MAG TPA: sigma-70 family RNA polymerase sigma factor [Longimicrobiales bacterium]|nr:sigma-70 family RNA polymerase sigma factor [Longimicrobiales bacterium]